MARIISLTSIYAFFQDDLKCIKRGENSYNSNHLVRCELKNNMLIGVVAASMKNKNYNVEITLAPDYSISAATCSCPRGKFICHHMACIVLHGHYNLSKTDVSCAWVLQPQSQPSTSKEVPQKVFQVVDDEAMDDTVAAESFREALRNVDHNCGLLWLMANDPKENEDKLVPYIEDILYSEEYFNSSNKEELLKNRLKVNSDQIKNVAARTAGQQENSAWLIARKHRLTASNFGEILAACRRMRFPKSLFDRLTGSYDLDGVRAIQWGRQNEKVAIEKFQATENVTVQETGLWLLECGYIGATPDGLVGDDCIIEVKCPYKYRHNNLKQVLQPTDVIWWEGGRWNVNTSHNYFYQIQGQLFCTNRDICKLIIYSTVDFVVVEIGKNQEWQKNIKILKEFYFGNYIKHILK